jgi:hypothetical protein
VRGGDAAIVERPVRGQAVDQRVCLARVDPACEETVAQLGGRVVTPAQETEGRGAR